MKKNNFRIITALLLSISLLLQSFMPAVMAGDEGADYESLGLPVLLPAVMEDGESAMIPVLSWESEPEYTGEIGEYILTPIISADFIYDEDILPAQGLFL